MSTVNTSSSTATTFTPPRGFDRVLGALQSLGRSLMLPIAVLPAAGLLLRLGQPDLLNLTWMAAAGNAVFANLPMIFSIGIAIGLTGGEGAAGLAAVVGFLVFTGVFNTLIPQVAGAPDPTINMGVLSGILIGLVAAGLYRRFYDIRLPDYLAFLEGGGSSLSLPHLPRSSWASFLPSSGRISRMGSMQWVPALYRLVHLVLAFTGS